MWREYLEKSDAKYSSNPPASIEVLEMAELALGFPLPDNLRSLLLEFNGFNRTFEEDMPGVEVEVLPPIEKITVETQHLIKHKEDFPGLSGLKKFLVLGDDGGGNYFIYVTEAALEVKAGLHMWYHESGELEFQAHSLREWIEDM